MIKYCGNSKKLYRYCRTGVRKIKKIVIFGAGEGIRTLDFNLGKVAITKIKAPFLNEYITFIVTKLYRYLNPFTTHGLRKKHLHI